MASIPVSSSPTSSLFPRTTNPSLPPSPPPPPSTLSFPSLHLRTTPRNPLRCRRTLRVRAVEEETVPSEGLVEAAPVDSAVEGGGIEEQQPVSVPISPSDVLTMLFKAEGTMSESAVGTVRNALEETEGVSVLNVQVLEGIANVELRKQTTVQATGVASNLVEILQGSGFKLQALNLSFDDEEDLN